MTVVVILTSANVAWCLSHLLLQCPLQVHLVNSQSVGNGLPLGVSPRPSESFLFGGPRVLRPSGGLIIVQGPLPSKANPSYMGSQSPPSIPPFSDLLEDSKEEQELVILQTASTADWRASACDFSFGNAPGELPFLFGNEGPFVPFFSDVPFWIPGWVCRWYQSICRGLFFIASPKVRSFVPTSGF